MVRNLFENARRHAGGVTEAHVESAPPAGWRLSVSDRGPGIPVDEQKRIFEPFYRPDQRDRAETPGDSTLGAGGLGLALVEQIAEHHGGHVSCAARPGGGTTFEVWLPAAVESSKR